MADNARQWRSDKPPAIAVEGRVGSGQSSPGLAPGLADTESTVGSAFLLQEVRTDL